MKDIAVLLDEIEKSDSRLIKNMASILTPRIVEKDECVLIATKSINNFNLNIYHDRTEAEAIINHYHFDDSKLKKYLSLIARNWISVLQSFFPEKSFIFYIEQGTTLRFHQVRSTEAPWHDIENTQYLKKEKIFVYNVRSSPDFIKVLP